MLYAFLYIEQRVVGCKHIWSECLHGLGLKAQIPTRVSGYHPPVHISAATAPPKTFLHSRGLLHQKPESQQRRSPFSSFPLSPHRHSPPSPGTTHQTRTLRAVET